ncbi:MAG TPA: phage tail sheath protein, partial [Ruminiclostridium sp.]|nr:phage tail sheath protein [Ruminiclostridium sp.]
PNSYDNKILLITSINDYLEGLVTDQLLDSKATNSAYIDIDAQRAYLNTAGVDTGSLNEQQIKEYNTNDKVFLSGTIKPLDAIEDISLVMAI